MARKTGLLQVKRQTVIHYPASLSLLSVAKGLKERQKGNTTSNLWPLMRPKRNDAAHSKLTADAHRTGSGIPLDSRQAHPESTEVSVNCSHNHSSYPSVHMAAMLCTDFTKVSLKFH